MVLPKQTSTERSPLVQPPLYAERSFTGHGQERGGVQTLLTNPSTTEAVDFVYLESLPWFMKPYLHTLKAKLSSPEPSSPPVDQANDDSSSLIKRLHYRPALDRHRPTHLEILLSVPANSTVTLTYDFDKAILRYTEYPPDANRGFDVAPTIIGLLAPSSNSSTFSSTLQDVPNPQVYLRTTSLLLYLPTPDFSMPYNVIILTSTVMALAFGFVFNLLVRRFVGAAEVDGETGPKKWIRLVRDKVGLLRRKMGGVKQGKEAGKDE